MVDMLRANCGEIRCNNIKLNLALFCTARLNDFVYNLYLIRLEVVSKAIASI